LTRAGWRAADQSQDREGARPHSPIVALL